MINCLLETISHLFWNLIHTGLDSWLWPRVNRVPHCAMNNIFILPTFLLTFFFSLNTLKSPGPGWSKMDLDGKYLICFGDWYLWVREIWCSLIQFKGAFVKICALLEGLWLRGRALCRPEGRQFEGLPHLHAKVSLGKMLNPELPLIEQQSAANRCTVCMCVRENWWM